MLRALGIALVLSAGSGGRARYVPNPDTSTTLVTVINGQAISPSQVTASTLLVDAGYFGTLNVTTENVGFVDAGNVQATTFTAMATSTNPGFVLSAQGAKICLEAACTNNIRSIPGGGGGVNIYSSASALAGWDNGTGNYVHKIGDITVAAGGAFDLVTKFAIRTAPTASAGFCTSPSVSASNGTAAFEVTIGSACAGSTGTITLPAATTAWVCTCHDVTSPAGNYMEQTGGSTTTCTMQNYSRTLGTAANFTSADVFRCTAMGY